MDILRTPEAMRGWTRAQRGAGRRIGFVPTMGWLHAGHLSLVKIARTRADAVVVSLFVNPLQFGPAEDLARYPRDLDRDERLCREAGVDALFYPAVETMYPAGHSTFVEETVLSRGLCGGRRPGHFRGVTTVVAKLFNLVQPDAAVFGQKDAQQARVIARMARDLDFPVDIVIGPIVREADGLAMSSRNQYLSPDERRQALVLHRALDRAEALVRDGERRVNTLAAAMRAEVESAPAARVDYIELVDADTLAPASVIEGPVLAALAVWLGTTRLIDNTVLTPGVPGQRERRT